MSIFLVAKVAKHFPPWLCVVGNVQPRLQSSNIKYWISISAVYPSIRSVELVSNNSFVPPLFFPVGMCFPLWDACAVLTNDCVLSDITVDKLKVLCLCLDHETLNLSGTVYSVLVCSMRYRPQVWSRWLDIGFVFVLFCSVFLLFFEPKNAKKRMRLTSSHLHRKSLVNKGFIIRPCKTALFFSRDQESDPKQARETSSPLGSPIGTQDSLHLSKSFNKTCSVIGYCCLTVGSSGVPLMQCLVPLLSRVQHGIGGRTAVALFRCLFWYYKHHWDSELEQEIYK